MLPSYHLSQSFTLLNRLVHSGLSFAAFRCPGSDGVEFVASETFEQLSRDGFKEVLGRDGFVWAPFDVDKHPVLFIPNQIVDIDALNQSKHLIKDAEIGYPSHFASQFEYTTQVSELVDTISIDGLQKAILSRIIPTPSNWENSAQLFSRLCEQYANAYVFCVQTPYSGLWIGATPELFLHKEGDMLSTVALAGTRKALVTSGDVQTWMLKEKDEQAVVADFIADVLAEHSITSFEKTGPAPVQAGQVSHLKTTFRFRAALNAFQLSSLAFALHPTPAVAGLPKHRAMAVIAAVEKHDRAYYGGFMGRVGSLDCQLFVTLRCMMVSEKQSFLFVGGGITKQSNPLAEWDETVLKSQTLLSVLKNI